VLGKKILPQFVHLFLGLCLRRESGICTTEEGFGCIWPLYCCCCCSLPCADGISTCQWYCPSLCTSCRMQVLGWQCSASVSVLRFLRNVQEKLLCVHWLMTFYLLKDLLGDHMINCSWQIVCSWCLGIMLQKVVKTLIGFCDDGFLASF
jgi:hypothetical protein